MSHYKRIYNDSSNRDQLTVEGMYLD